MTIEGWDYVLDAELMEEIEKRRHERHVHVGDCSRFILGQVRTALRCVVLKRGLEEEMEDARKGAQAEESQHYVRLPDDGRGAHVERQVESDRGRYAGRGGRMVLVERGERAEALLAAAAHQTDFALTSPRLIRLFSGLASPCAAVPVARRGQSACAPCSFRRPTPRH